MAFEEFLVACAVEMLKSLLLFVMKEVRMASDMEKELKKLQRTVMIIQEVLEEAEKQQIGKDLLKIWLKELKDIAYEADDILDEFSYQIMRSHEMSFRKRDQLRMIFSISNLRFHPHMADALKNVNGKMDDIATHKVLLDLRNGHSLRLSSFNEQHRDYHETTSFIDEKQVIGRQKDKEIIIDSFLMGGSSSSSSSTVSVVPIVGMAGLGKTTLAKLIFNAEVVSDIFEEKIWVHVSFDFNVKKILRHIIASVTESSYDRDTNMDVLERIMKEKLGGKRYLLVLDDLWNVKVDQWNKLKNQLNVGEHGSKIIVTTRSSEVADVVQGRANSTYTLQVLSENECWSIIRQRAFAPGGLEETENLVAICKDMGRRCGGVPLAAKDLGDLLHSTRNEAGWSNLRDGTNWRLLEKNEMLPALRFSYIHLPSPVKQCFAYCSLFPKGSIIEKQTLIQLWMAEGFVHPSDRNRGKELEDIGNDYFNSLLKNSLLRGEGRPDHNGAAQSCKLHHLVHDFAQDIVGSNECSILKVSQIAAKDTSELRRLRLILEEGTLEYAEQLQTALKLRTLFIHNNGGDKSINYQKLLRNKQFRVLDMQGTSIKGLPPSIGNMKHLRYLDLSRTEIEELPEFITGLYNLHTLLLRYCVKLRKFPETMGTLKRMRYLDISGSQFEELPDCITHLSNLQTLKLEDCRNIQKLPGNIKNMINLRHLFLSKTESWNAKPNEIGSLTRLQTLTQFKVGKCNTSGFSTIRELECLNLLEGELWISNLEEVTRSDDAEKANLKRKQNIQSLIMEWSFRTHDASDGTVMKQLQPNGSLKKLKIVNYLDPKFPTWMMGSSISSALPNLVEIELRGCYVCQQLPGLGQLPSLRVLTIATMDVVLCLGDDFYGDHKACKPFQELVEFTLTDLPCLEKWCIAQPPFPFYPRLEKLSVERCRMLEHRQDLNFTKCFFPKIKEYKLDGVTLLSRTTRKIVSMVPSRQI